MRCAPQIADFLGIDRRGEAKNSEEYNLLKKGTIPKIPIRTQFLLGVGLNPHTQELSPYNKKKWAFLVDSPYLISNKCCSVMKKSPAHEFQRKTKRKPITAQTAEESQLRQSQWLKNGCNGFDMKSPISNPMSFWTEQDILHYIKENNLEICSVYGDIVLEEAIWGDNGEIQSTIADMFREYNGQILKTTGLKRTGCMFCGYGCHLEKSEGRFERMKKTHPAQYDYIMRPKDKGGLDYKAVIDWLNENGGLNIRY